MRLLRQLRHWALVIGHSAFVLGVFAENAPPASLRFLFLDESPGAYHLKTSSGYRQVSAAPYIISPPYHPADFARLEIYKAGPAADPETGEYPRVKVASFSPPSGTTAALVIVTPRAPSPGELPNYGVELIDSSPSAFPGGSIRILNRGRSDLAGRFASEQIVVAPGASRLISPVGDRRGRIRTRVAVHNTASWRMIDDNVAIIKPDSRLTGVLVYSPSGMKFRLGNELLAERGDPPPSHVWITYSDSP